MVIVERIEGSSEIENQENEMVMKQVDRLLWIHSACFRRIHFIKTRRNIYFDKNVCCDGYDNGRFLVTLKFQHSKQLQKKKKCL